MYEIHIFTVIYWSLYGFITNQQNDQFPVGLLQPCNLDGRALHLYCRGNGFKYTGRNFFQALFHCCLNSVHHCDFKCKIFIYMKMNHSWIWAWLERSVFNLFKTPKKVKFKVIWFVIVNQEKKMFGIYNFEIVYMVTIETVLHLL